MKYWLSKTPQICFDWFVHTAWHSPLRRWHSDLWLLSAWWLFPATEPCFWLHKRRGQVDAIQPTSTQRWQDWGDLVYFATSPASDSFCSVRRWHRYHCACLFNSRYGIYIDSDLSMRTHNFQDGISTLRIAAPDPKHTSVSHSASTPVTGRSSNTVTSWLVYLQGSWIDSSQCSMLPLYSSTRPGEPSTCPPSYLHSLRVQQRIEFRLAVLAYRCLNGTAPPYLVDELQRVADISSRARLRFASTALLHVPRLKHKIIGDRPDHRLFCVPRRCREGLEQSAAVDNVVAVVTPVQKGAEDGTVPTFVQRRSYGDASRWSLFFNF